MQPAKKTSGRGESENAIAMLMEDHQRVRQLFAEFKKIKDAGGAADATEMGGQKAELVAQICQELLIHAQLEEELFYPAARAAIADQDLMDESTVEHAMVKDLVMQLLEMAPGDDLYDAKVTVLCESVEHHVKEEEGSMFPQVRKAADLDDTLGDQLLQRKQELLIELSQPRAKQPARANGVRKSQGVQAPAH
ncbi:MAG TPA: hemerythrin domain-containing protein [Pseudomonadota bacterium]|nr:hemerythrin domain-containing protein [Pseudomonadota bacterium]